MADPWDASIPARYHPGAVVDGQIAQICRFGVLVELEPGIVALVHCSEVDDELTEDWARHFYCRQQVTVKVLAVHAEARKIGASIKRARWRRE